MKYAGGRAKGEHPSSSSYPLVPFQAWRPFALRPSPSILARACWMTSRPSSLNSNSSSTVRWSTSRRRRRRCIWPRRGPQRQDLRARHGVRLQRSRAPDHPLERRSGGPPGGEAECLLRERPRHGYALFGDALPAEHRSPAGPAALLTGPPGGIHRHARQGGEEALRHARRRRRADDRRRGCWHYSARRSSSGWRRLRSPSSIRRLAPRASAIRCRPWSSRRAPVPRPPRRRRWR